MYVNTILIRYLEGYRAHKQANYRVNTNSIDKNKQINYFVCYKLLYKHYAYPQIILPHSLLFSICSHNCLHYLRKLCRIGYRHI